MGGHGETKNDLNPVMVSSIRSPTVPDDHTSINAHILSHTHTHTWTLTLTYACSHLHRNSHIHSHWNSLTHP